MTDLWGPYGWEFMHYTSFSYPEFPTKQDKESYYKFYVSIGDVLPCEKCRIHYKQNMVKHDLLDALDHGKQGLVRWVLDMHNEVNIIKGREIWSIERLLDKYKKVTNDYYNEMFMGGDDDDDVEIDDILEGEGGDDGPNYLSLMLLVLVGGCGIFFISNR